MAQRTETGATYTVHLRPPAYPDKLFPGRCRHEPQFVMMENIELPDRKAGRKLMEIDHHVCFACGRSLEATYGGNVLVDLQMLWGELGWHAQLGARIIYLRDRWARIACRLFGPDGWNGRHERVARMIDPNLTMKMEIEDMPGGENRMGRIRFDSEYLRPAEDEERLAA